MDRIDLASPGLVTVTSCQTEMFGHLVMVDYLARSHAALGRRLARTRRPRPLTASASSRMDRCGEIGLYHGKM